MAGAGRGKLVGINEESSVGVTGVNREHPVVDILLGALAIVARSQQSAGTVGVQASLKPGGLSVVVVSITVSLGDVLQDDSPVALNVDGTGDLGVVNIAGAKVALRADPVAGIIGRGSLAGTSVVLVVKRLLLGLGDVLDKVISRLVGNISVLLQEKRILGDLVGNVVGGVLRVQDAVGKVGALGALGGSLGVTVAMAMVRFRVVRRRGIGSGGGGVGSRGGGVWSRGIGGGCVWVSGPYCHNGDNESNTSNLKNKKHLIIHLHFF